MTRLRRRPMRFAAVLAMAVLLPPGCTDKEPATETRTAGTGRATPDTQATLPTVVLDMITAHGGLVAWRAAPTVSFEDEFSSPGSPSAVSRVMVEQSRRRAYLDFPADSASIAWDGAECWSTNWKQPYPPRFLALLNYYFLNLPWLTADPGVKLGDPVPGRLFDDPTEYATVMMTFEAGTGDTPDDYYRLYIDPVTKRLKACAYVVTYRALLPEGAASTPEHILVFDEHATVNGLVVPTKYTIYGTDHSVIAACSVRDWAFDRPFDEARMVRGEGGVVDSSTP